MDQLDQKILDLIQSDFPLVPRPYAKLAENLGVSEEEAFQHVSALRESGVIRQLSANFWAGRLGYVSTLCGAKVPKDKLESFIEMVNACKSVTHNYLRDHPYNVWFTLICASKEETQAILDDFGQKSGVKILNLPATKIYKIKVDFKMQEK
ncbi:MAG: AsnC family transcriptional regulator [Desulfovibrionaceae bacterium]|nr:AsnC family transcriptional regulator [Desulfovibrionaceae bacterium]